MRIVVLTALWRRHDLARLVMRRYMRIARELNGIATIEGFAVGSEGSESQKLAEDSGFLYHEAPNQPLGAKWNQGLAAARRRLKPDALVVAGSDDWMTAPVFEHFVKALADGKHFIGFQDICFLYWKKMTTLYFGGYTHPARIGEPLGLGRCLSAPLLKKVGWRPWWNSRNRGLDLSMTKTIRAATTPAERKKMTDVRKMADVGGMLLDIKTPIGICSVQSYLGSPNAKWTNTDEVLAHFPQDEVTQLRALLASLR